MIEDLLRGFVAGLRVDDIDFSTTLPKLSAEYVSDDLLRRHEDTVWRVRLRGGWLVPGGALEWRWRRANPCRPCCLWCCTTARGHGGRLGRCTS